MTKNKELNYYNKRQSTTLSTHKVSSITNPMKNCLLHSSTESLKMYIKLNNKIMTNLT